MVNPTSPTSPADRRCDLPIIVAVDGSEASSMAVEWAAAAASQRQHPLKLVTAYSMPQFMYADGMVPPQELYDDLEAEASEKIDAARATALAIAPGIHISHDIREAAPIDLLLECSSSAEMIVMGSRGLGGLSGLVMGSVSAAVVSHADCPVVVVRKDTVVPEEHKNGPVVVGVDGSPVSRQAVDMAFREAQSRGVPLRAVYAWTDATHHPRHADLPQGEEQLRRIVEHHRAILSRELEGPSAAYPGVEVEQVVEHDRPIHALSESAKDAQLLVLGSHGRGGFKGMLIGSTSRALLQYTPCPMMVVRPREDA